MIYALGDISGAHFNPAVTVAILCSKLDEKFTLQDAGCYVLTQIVAGITAAMTYALIHTGKSFPLGPGSGFVWAQVGIAEFVFTFVLCLVVLCVAVSPKTNNKTMFGFAIGSCVTVGGFAIGCISGGSLIPAVSFGIAAANIFKSGPSKALIYTICELLGGVAAASVMQITHADEEKSKDEEKALACATRNLHPRRKPAEERMHLALENQEEILSDLVEDLMRESAAYKVQVEQLPSAQDVQPSWPLSGEASRSHSQTKT